MVLKLDGYIVEPFESPQEALRCLSDTSCEDPAAIVLDLNMPELDGREFYRRARAMGYHHPVLILSAYDAFAARDELGADAALAKPFSPDDLSEILRGLIGSN